VELVDIYPTLCDLAGLPKPDDLEGLSAAPLLDQPDRPWKPAAFSQFPRGKVMGYSMRTDRYRYTVWQQRKGGRHVAAELYDHLTDPDENVNVVASEENADLVARLQQQLDAGWRADLPPD
jgi:arylsulfatase A-like enzyme